MWEILLLVFILGFIVAIAIPNRVNRHRTSPANACINNLRQLDAAACQFALETGKTHGDHVNFPTDLTPYIKLNSAGSIPPCPQGGVYHIDKVGEMPTCTLSTLTPAHKLQ